jgi:response regulator of citrate/malate metabolism
MRILIVEDDPMVRSINVGFIKKISKAYKIYEAADVPSAVKILEQEAIDLILLDVYLGKAKGPELLKWLRETHRKAEVILITADNSVETIEESFKLGAIDYLIKPFSFNRFEEAVAKASIRIERLKQKGTFGQADIDAMIQAGNKEASYEKGMNVMTYQAVEEALFASQEPLTAQDVAEKTHLARVTVRRYLEQMVHSGNVNETLSYGKVGRPQKHYMMKKEG